MAGKFTSYVVVGAQVFGPGDAIPDGVEVDNPKIEVEKPKRAPAKSADKADGKN